MSTAAAPAAAPPAKRSLWAKLAMPLIVVGSIAMIVLLRVGYLFVLLALLPSIVAWFADREPEKIVAKTVFACNFAGLMPFIVKLALTGSDTASVLHIIGAPTVWLIIFSCAAAGWALVWVCSQIAHAVLHVFYRGQIAYLEGVQAKLVEEWGPQIKRRD